MWRRESKVKSQNTAEAIADLIRQAEREQMRKERRRRHRQWFGWIQEAPSWLKTLITVTLVVLVALIADGIRRESKEFKATLVSFSGSVSVFQNTTNQWVPAKPEMALRDKDVVRTGANGTAILVFPDGSAIQLESNTEFEVRLLDFVRGGVRDRSFMVRFGSAVAYVSQFFGAKSQATVCTPTAVAAVRGTGFRVVYDPATKQTIVQVVDGSVRFRTPITETASQPGQMAAASGYQLVGTQPLSPEYQRVLAATVTQLRRFEQPPSLLQRIEWAINNALDPFLQILGLTPGGWSYASANFARRTMCMEALRRLRTHLESLNELPDYLNPVTLQELTGVHPKEKERILSAFAGNMLESYRKIGRDQYIVRARAKDKKRTLYEMTIAEIREVPE
ncbi:FecR family protein [Fervidibacter sacchari]